MSDLTAAAASAARPTAVYSYFDEHDVLIYVGITGRGTRRQSEHSRSKDWWPLVARQEVEHFPDRNGARRLESHLIRTLRPPFNKQENTSHADALGTYLAMRERLSEINAQDPVDLARSVERCLPLHPIDGGFAFDLAHTPIVSRLEMPEGSMRITADGGRWSVAGKALSLERSGPFTFIRANVRPEYAGEPGVARFKIVTAKPRDGGPWFMLQKVVVHVGGQK